MNKLKSPSAAELQILTKFKHKIQFLLNDKRSLLSKQEVCKITGFSPTVIDAVLSGKESFRVSTIEQMAKVLLDISKGLTPIQEESEKKPIQKEEKPAESEPEESESDIHYAELNFITKVQALLDNIPSSLSVTIKIKKRRKKVVSGIKVSKNEVR